MIIKTFEFNPLGVNTYVLHDDTKECAIIDAACLYTDERELLVNYIVDHNLVVRLLLNTHLHFDHLFGVKFISSRFDVPLSCHEEDAFLLEDIPNQLKRFGLPPIGDSFKPEVGDYLNEGETISFGKQILDLFHIPGHSPGGIVFYSASNKCLFTGDVLFHSSIGRTDLYGGSYEVLVQGIREKLFSLPDDTIVYPGHGPSTTIGYEKNNNPFVGQIG